MVKYVLNYFKRPSRGETIGLLFHAAEVDNRMTEEEWQENKHDCELLNF